MDLPGLTDRIAAIAFAAAGIAMVMTHLVLCAGLLLARLRERRGVSAGNGNHPLVSVIVPARNEERSLPLLFASLERQRYRRMEIVLVNDRSDDATGRLMEQFAARFPDRVRIVTLSSDTPRTNPKQYALARGVEQAAGDIYLFTDADCEIPADWVGGMAGRFLDPSIGLVFAPVVTRTDSGYLSRYQAFDHMFRYAYTAASAGLGMATGGFGNNMAVRREALGDIGGFGSLAYSVTEDAELISELRSKTRWSILGLTDPAMRVTTAPEQSFRRLVRQELRWNTGGIFAPEIATRLSYRYVMFHLSLSVLAIPFALLFAPLLFLPLSSFVSMSLVALLGGMLGSMPVRGYWNLLPFHVVFSMGFYSWITLLTLFRVPVKWKGGELRRMQ